MKKYIIMMVSGIVLTLLLFCTIWVSSCWDIVFNVFAMLGSGVFCSAIVSLIVEQNNERREKQRKQEQRDFLLSSLKNAIELLTMAEINALSRHCLLDRDEKQVKRIKEDMLIHTAIGKIREYISIVVNNTELLWPNTPNIDTDLIDRMNTINKFAYKETVIYYQAISKILLNIISDSSSYYANGILNDKQIDELKTLSVLIEDVILNSNENTLDLLISYKDILFENLEANLDVLQMDRSRVINYRIYKVQEKQSSVN